MHSIATSRFPVRSSTPKYLQNAVRALGDIRHWENKTLGKIKNFYLELELGTSWCSGKRDYVADVLNS